MTEHEYSDELMTTSNTTTTINAGGKEEPHQRVIIVITLPEDTGDEKGTRQRTEKADSTDRLSINADSNKVKAPTSTRHDIAECQPTSSKVLMKTW